MHYQFTSGAERVLYYAAGCTSPADYTELAGPAILLGLLAEAECRAALLLAPHGITRESVCKRWPGLLATPPNSGIPTALLTTFTHEIEQLLQMVSQLTDEHVHPPMIATEHLLLGLLMADNELAHWLSEQGVRLETIEADVRKRHGYQSGPLPIETSPFDPISEKELQKKVNSGQWAVDSGQRESASGLVHPSSFILHPSLRILDAAANRAREGLRVAEDFVRFVLDDRHLTEQCKQMRHDLAALLERIPSGQLLVARETQADVGTSLSTHSEEHRTDAAGVVLANFARLQESLRSLEEYGKLIEPAWGAEFKQIRYRAYTLQRAVEITRDSIERLSHARLYVLMDGRSSLDEFRQLSQSLIDAGVHLLQLRDKNLDDRQLLERGRLLRELTRDTGTLFIMNDRPDLAALCQADGVHVGQDDLSVKDARTILGAAALIGVSTHTIEQARQAVLDGANYIGVGPTFPSDTKQFDSFPGLQLLRAVAAEIRLPAFAIGGISAANLPQVLASGFSRVAVSGAILSASDPAAAARDLLEGFRVQGSGFS